MRSSVIENRSFYRKLFIVIASLSQRYDEFIYNEQIVDESEQQCFRMYAAFSGFFVHFTATHIFCFTCVHYIEVFFDEGTRKSVHCSEVGGVHYIEVYLQQKSIGGTERCVHMGGVHYTEVFTNGGFTVYYLKLFTIKILPARRARGKIQEQKLK